MGCSASGAQSAVVPLETSATSSMAPKRLLDEYMVREQLGEGAFGVVYNCINRESGREAAVKMVDKVETPVDDIQREVEMLKGLKHDNIVRFHSVYHEKCFVCIVMDKYPGGDLIAAMHRHNGKVEGRSILHVFRQLLAPICYIHEQKIVHRDVKGDNFLLDRRDFTDPGCRVVLTDFGTARGVRKGERLRERVGTRLFWAPEFYDGNYGMKVDVWAVGICVFGLLSGNFPFQDEFEVRKKTPKLRGVGSACEDFVRSMLKKAEKQRLHAAAAMDHSWIRPADKKRSSMESMEAQRLSEVLPMSTKSGVALCAESIHEGVSSRRQELLQRMNDRHRGRKSTKHHLPVDQRQFVIVDKNIPGLMYHFEWQDKQKAEAAGLLTHGTQFDLGKVDGDINRSPAVVDGMLCEHSVDTAEFGRGEAKSLDQLAAEVRTGEARLMLDAADYKKLVRVVDVVLIRLSWMNTDTQACLLLIEKGEKYPDGRRRDIARLPGTKRRPWESVREAAQRLLSELLTMGDCNVDFNLEETEVFQEELESPSFPGVMTVYRKEIVPCVLQPMPSQVLEQFGLPDGNPWTAEDPRKNVKYLQWVTEAQAGLAGVQLSARGSEDVCTLVHAPIGYNEQALRSYLEEHGVDVANFGQGDHKTVRELSQELTRGQASIMTSKAGKVIRIVDIVALVIENPQTGELLVQTEQISPGGEKLPLHRLPGGNCRPDENHFLTARRILQKTLRIDEDLVSFSMSGVEHFEDMRKDVDYPGIWTTYRTHVLPVQMSESRPGSP
mmetsp:Transcript_83129/g.243732  ORF Transcript_83129/g.243732 Transcript_83129/m.243732 type:complete len:779 (-) Transcript_83129:93-2429(-)